MSDPAPARPELQDQNAVDAHHCAVTADDNPSPSEVWRGAWGFVKDPQHANAMVAIFTVLLFLSTLTYTVFAGLQWRTMKRQLEEMQSGAADTHDLSVQAKTQAEATKQLAETAGRQIDKMESQITELRRQSVAAGRMVQETRRSIEVGNRAYLGVTDARYWQWVPDAAGILRLLDGNKTAPFGRMPHLEVILVNKGNTPAANMEGWYACELLKPPIQWESLKATGTRGEVRNRDVAKDGLVTITATPPLTDAQHSDIVNGRRDLAIFGVVGYRDVFGGYSETSFCFRYNPKANDVSPCPGHNHMK